VYNFEDFPRKRVLWNRHPDVIKKRRRQLQKFLNDVPKEYHGSHLKAFLDIKPLNKENTNKPVDII